MDFKEVILQDGEGGALSPITMAASIQNEDGTLYMESVASSIQGLQNQLNTAKGELQTALNTAKETVDAEIANIANGTTAVVASNLNTPFTINGQTFKEDGSLVTTTFSEGTVASSLALTWPSPPAGRIQVVKIGLPGGCSVSLQPYQGPTIVLYARESNIWAGQFYPVTSSKVEIMSTSSSASLTTYYFVLIGC